MSRICIEIGNDIARRIIDQLVMPNFSTSVYQLGYDVESKAYLMASYPLTNRQLIYEAVDNSLKPMEVLPSVTITRHLSILLSTSRLIGVGPIEVHTFEGDWFLDVDKSLVNWDTSTLETPLPTDISISSREYRHSIEEWIISQWRIHEILIN